MTDPTTEAGRALLDIPVSEDDIESTVGVDRRWLQRTILAIEAQARAAGAAAAVERIREQVESADAEWFSMDDESVRYLAVDAVLAILDAPQEEE